MIAVTGDLVDGSVAQLSHHTEPMSRLSARHGAYFVTGNHEYYSGVHGWLIELRRLGLRVLMNEHVVLQHDGAEVVVAGVTDYSAHHFDASHRSDPSAALARAPSDAAVKLLLAHQPQVGVSGGTGRLSSPALGPYPRRPVLAMELLRAAAAAVHGRTASPRRSVGLHQPGHRLLGPTQAPGRSLGDHAPSLGAGRLSLHNA